MLFYYPGDGNWWLGSFSAGGASLTWRLVGNTASMVGPFWVEDFDADGRSNLLFHNPVNGSWSLGTISTGGALSWKSLTKTGGAGVGWPGNFWTGYFRGVLKPDLLHYQPATGDWWLGTVTGSQFAWQHVGNTSGFGDVRARPWFTGYFKGSGGIDVLFYAADGNWWFGSLSGTSLGWTLAGSTGRSYAARLRIHYKLLANPDCCARDPPPGDKGSLRRARHPRGAWDDGGPDGTEPRARRSTRPRRRGLHFLLVAHPEATTGNRTGCSSTARTSPPTRSSSTSAAR